MLCLRFCPVVAFFSIAVRLPLVLVRLGPLEVSICSGSELRSSFEATALGLFPGSLPVGLLGATSKIIRLAVLSLPLSMPRSRSKF